jgi:GNAT superfamily N-acetyltransferase
MAEGPGGESVIRRAHEADSLCIAVLGTQVFLDTYATEGIRPALAREVLEALSPRAVVERIGEAATTFLVAERNGHLVGFAQFTAQAGHERVPYASPTELERLYVLERFTGRGLGKLLLRHAEDAARASGADGIWLTCWSRNIRALAFYASQGYEELGPTLFEVYGEQHENRLFAKPLGSMRGRSPG